MVKPNQPKGIKPKAEITETPAPVSGGAGFNIESLSGVQLVIINTVITIVISVIFLTGNYLIVNGVVGSKLAHIGEITAAIHGEGEEEEAEGEKQQRGIIIDLGEFIVNLSDPAAKRYLKVNVALELTKSEHDPGATEQEAGGGHGGHGGGEAVDPLAMIEKEMKQFNPSMRDAIISVLSTKTPEELSSLAGKELAKEQIKESIDPIFAGEREVMRVSFGSFIIQ